MSNFSLKKVLIYSLVLAITLPMLTFGVFSVFFSRNAIKAEQVYHNRNLTELLVAQINEFLNQPLEDIYTLKSILNQDHPDNHSINLILQSLVKTHQYLLKIEVLNSAGMVTHVAPHDEQYLKIDKSNMKLYKKVSTTDRTYWSETIISPQLKQPVVTVSVPYKNGIITAFLVWPKLDSLFQEIELGRDSYITVTDQSATYIFHSNYDEVLTRSFDPFYHELMNLVKHGTHVKKLEISAQKYICYFDVVKGNDWLVAVYQSEREVYAAADFLTKCLISGIIAAILLGSLYAIYQGQHISKAFNELIHKTKFVSSGNYDTHIEENGYHEFAELAQHFNAMTLSVANREKILIENESNIKATLNSIADAVITTDLDGLITRMNPRAELITHRPFSDCERSDLCDAFRLYQDEESGINRIREELKQLKKDTNLRDELELLDKEGNRITISYSLNTICTEAGNVLGAVLVFRDISEQLDMEEKLKQAQKMDSIGQLAGGIAHDFNNMLCGIISSTTVLEMAVEGNKELEPIINSINNSAFKAAELTKKLLTFSRKSMIHKEILDIHALIKDTLIILRRSIDKKIEIVHQLEAEKFNVEGDSSQLQNVILNLGINARDAMTSGGAITITTSNIKLDKTYCDASAFELGPGNYIKISVCDTGVGMAKHISEHIFEPFFTTKATKKGTGLGLAVVYGTIKEHLGEILVFSEEKQGSEFQLFLPVSIKDIPQKIKNDKSLQVGEGTVLVIDDEEVIRENVSIILNKCGYHVIEAADGESGVALFRDHQDEIDFVLVDMIMPKKDGSQVLQEINKIKPGVKSIVMSGFSEELQSELIKKYASAFIQKPFTLKMLVGKFEEIRV